MKITELQKVPVSRIGNFVKKFADKVENQIIGMFRGDGRVRRMMIIEKNGRLLDIIK